MYCKKCGTENPEGASYCRNCGIELGGLLGKTDPGETDVSSSESIPADVSTVDEETPEGKSSGTTFWSVLLWVCIGALVLVILGILLILVFGARLPAIAGFT